MMTTGTRMWNSSLRSLLQQVIEGMAYVGEYTIYEQSLIGYLRLNAFCHGHKDALELRSPMSNGDVERINEACCFLFEEFGAQIHPKQTDKGYQYPSTICSKLTLFNSQQLAFPDELGNAFVEHEGRVRRIELIPLDCLFVTAMPREFLAVVRRLDGFAIGTRPDAARGFRDIENDHVGWVKGCVTDGDRIASVMVICGSRYGPTHAAVAVKEAFRIAKPRYVVVVGIAASLDDGTELALGDIGFSTELVDIHLGKDRTDVSIETPFSTTYPLDMSKVPAHVRKWVGSQAICRYAFTGVLGDEDAQLLKEACESEADKSAIDLLVGATMATAEKTDLKSTAKTLPQPGTMGGTKLNEMVKGVQTVRVRNTWIQRVHLRRPDSQTRNPKVVPSKTLSGSRVVKQNGMRRYLKKAFPGAMLVEMEAAGVGSACGSDWMPFVVKSACDWANPEKEKTWQPYCADVAAAFAVELALELAAK